MHPKNPLTFDPFPALFLFLTLLLPLSALGEGYLKPLKSGYWEGGTVDNRDNGQADYCQLAAYNNQGFAILLIWMDQGLLYAMSNPRWTLKKGHRYDVVLAVDGRWTDRQKIKATDSDTLAWLVGNDAKAIEALQKGSRLKATGKMGKYVSALTGTRKAIDALRDCYRDEVAALSQVEPASTDPQKEADQKTTSGPVVSQMEVVTAQPSSQVPATESLDTSVPVAGTVPDPRPGTTAESAFAPTRVAELSPRELGGAAQGFALLGRESARDAFIVFMTPEAEEAFAPITEKIGPGWRYLFSSAVPSFCHLSSSQALVLQYSPWADVGLVTLWQQAGDGPEIHDAELLPGDFLRNGPKGTFDLIPYWLREGARIPPMAAADAVEAARLGFADLCVAAPPGAFRGLEGLADPETLSAGHLASTLMLGQAGSIGLGAYLREPGFAAIRATVLPLLESLIAGEVPGAFPEAEIDPPTLLQDLAASDGPPPAYLAAIADGERGFMFLRLTDDPFHFLSLAFDLADGEALLTHAHRLSYGAAALERLARGEEP